MSTLQARTARGRFLPAWRVIAVAAALATLVFLLVGRSAIGGALTLTSVTPTDSAPYVAGTSQNYDVRFTTATGAGAGASVVVEFDPDFDLSGVPSPDGWLLASSGVTPLNWKYRRHAELHAIEFFQIGGDEELTAGDPVMFRIMGVTNPALVQTTDDFVITTFDAQGVEVDTGTAPGLTISHAAPAQYTILDPDDGTVDNPITVTVEMQDQYGNRVTSNDGDGSVTLVADGNATGAGVVALDDGIGTIDISNETAETVQLSLSDGGGLDVSSTQDVVFAPGAAWILTVSQQPTQTDAGETIAPAVTVSVLDRHGNTATDAAGSITVAIEDILQDLSADGPTLGGTTTRSVVGGVATFDDLSLEAAGTFTLGFEHDPTELTTESVQFNVVPGPATHLRITADEDEVVADEDLEIFISARDEFENIATSYTNAKDLVFTGPGDAPNGSASPSVIAGPSHFSLSDPAQIVFDEGLPNVDVYFHPQRAETVTLNVSDGTLDSFGDPSYGLALTVLAGEAGDVPAITADPTEIPADGVSQSTITVQLLDERGNPVTVSNGETVCVITLQGTLSSTTGDGACGGGNVIQADDQGVGTFTAILTSSTNIETAILSALINTVLSDASATVDFVAGDPAMVVLSEDDEATDFEADATAGDEVEVHLTLLDAAGHQTSFTGLLPVTFAGLAASPDGDAAEVDGTAIEDGDVTVVVEFTDGQGVVTVEAFRAGAGQTLAVTAVDGDEDVTSGEAGGQSFTLNVRHDEATNLRAVPEPDIDVIAGWTGAGDLTLEAYDAYGNLADGANGADDTFDGSVDVVFSGLSNAPDGDDVPAVFVSNDSPEDWLIGSPVPVTFAGGVSEDLVILAYRAGTETLHATAGAVSTLSAGGQGLTVEVAADSSYLDHFHVDADTVVVAGDEIEVTLTVHDMFGNVITDYEGDHDIRIYGFASPNGTRPLLEGVEQTEDGDAPVTVTFTEGVSAPGALTLRLFGAAASQTVQFFEEDVVSSPGFGSNIYQVTVRHAPDVDSFGIFEDFVGDQTAGAEFEVDVFAYDAYGNDMDGQNGATAFTGTVTFEVAPGGATGGAGFGTSSAPFVGGRLEHLLTFTGISSGAGADDTRIIATVDDGGDAEGETLLFTVQPGPLDHFLVEQAGGGDIGTQAAGVGFEIGITARDANNNTLAFGEHEFGDDPDETVDLGTNSTFFDTTEDALGGFSQGVLDPATVELRGAGANRTITATLTGGVATGTSAGFTVEPGDPAVLLIQLEPESATTGVLAVQPVIRVHDAFGNLMDGLNDGSVTVTIEDGPAAAQVTGDVDVDVVAGTVTFTDLAVDTPGDYVLRFTITGVDDIAPDFVLSAEFTVAGGSLSDAEVALDDLGAGAVDQIEVLFQTTNAVPSGGEIRITFPAGFNVGGASVFSSTNVAGTLSVSTAGEVVVITSDAGGDIIPAGAAVIIVLEGVQNPTATGPTGTFAIETRNSGGVLIDSAAGVAGATIVPGDPDPDASTVVVSGSPVIANGVSQATVTVTLRDAHGNLIPNFLVGLIEDGQVIGVADSTDANGEVTFAVDNVAAEEVTYIVTPDGHDPLTQTASVTFIEPVPHAENSSVTPASQSAAADGVDGAVVTVTARDADGEPISGVEVSLAQTGSSDIVPSGNTDGSGQTTFTVTSEVAETVTYTASAKGVQITQTVQVTFTPGATSEARSTFEASPTSTDTGGTVTLTVRLRDQFDNLVGANGDGTEVVIYLGDPDDDGLLFADGDSEGLTTNDTFSVTYSQGTPGTVTFYAFFGTDAVHPTGIGTPVDVTFTSPPPEPVATPTPTPTPTPGPTVDPVVTLVNEVESSPVEEDAPAEVSTGTDEGGSVKVNAPANALPHGGKLKAAAIGNLTELTSQAPPPEGADIALAFVLEATDADGNAITEFDQPIALDFTVPASSVPDGATDRTLVVVFWNGTKWVEVEATVTLNEDGSYSIQATVDHFTIFAVQHQPDRGRFVPGPAPRGVSLTKWGGGGYGLLASALPSGSVWVSSGGKLTGYTVGAPAFVNQAFTALFPAGIDAGQPVVVVPFVPPSKD